MKTQHHISTIYKIAGAFALSALFCLDAAAQSKCCSDIQTDSTLQKEVLSLKRQIEDNNHTYDLLIKKIDDILWNQKVGDIAFIDKVRLTGPPRWKPKNKDDKFASNPLQFYTYVFIPKSVNPNKKYPLIVLPHSGIHADFSTYYAHIIRELIAQEYVVVAAEYRGSTGYGKDTPLALLLQFFCDERIVSYRMNG